MPRDLFWGEDAVKEAAHKIAGRLLVDSWAAVWRNTIGGIKFARKIRKIREEIDRGAGYNHGVESSLRESVAGTERLRYNSVVDELMFFLVLRTRVLEELQTFLVAKGVDTSTLRRQIEVLLFTAPEGVKDKQAWLIERGSNESTGFRGGAG